MAIRRAGGRGATLLLDTAQAVSKGENPTSAIANG